MLNETKHIKIPKFVASEDDLDFDFLKSTGVSYIEAMGGGIWSDFNIHDPGITFLEMLCYAITDLSNRLNLPIQDLISSEEDRELKKQFYRAYQILPSCPVNALDYRKLFSDIPGVRNSWIIPYEQKLHINTKDSQLALDPAMFGPLDDDYKKHLTLQGLNTVVVDYDLNDVDENGDRMTIAKINKRIEKAYHQNRNLCENLVNIRPVDKHPIGVCATIELDTDVDEDLIHAQILNAIEDYFTPEIKHYSIKEMLEKGYRTDEIFDGPLLEKGFVDNKELIKSNLRSEVRLSDLVQIIMKIDGVKLIKDISIQDCKGNKDGSAWVVCLDPYTRPTLCPTEKTDDTCCTQSTFNYLKDILPITYNPTKVEKHRETLREEKREQELLASLDRRLKVQPGTFRTPGETTTIQNDLPDTYGISPFGLPASATVQRKSQALQLKAYLTFFDQILSTYFAHLAKVKDLLSISTGVTPTYFTQAVKDIKDFDKIVSGYDTEDDQQLGKLLLDDLDDNIERRNQLLDHLLARFAESFTEYTFLMRELYGKAADEIVLYSKEQFLKEYVDNPDAIPQNIRTNLSNSRGKGHNLSLEHWDTKNVSGTQRRIARLSGMRNFTRRNISSPQLSIYQVPSEEYRWWVKMPSGQKVLSATTGYTSDSKAADEMYQAIKKVVNVSSENVEKAFKNGITDGTQIDNLMVEIATSGKYYFNVIDTDQLNGSAFEIIAIYPKYVDTPEELKEDILEILKYFKQEFTEEGIFIVEHILLLPHLSNTKAETDVFLPVCIDDGDICCSADPYSFRVSIILPGYTQRFSDPDFRNFMELLIQRELPAHIVPRICWIGHREGQEDEGEINELTTFERLYERHLYRVRRLNTGEATELEKSEHEQTTKEFKSILYNLHSLYPVGRLHDCEDEDDLEGKIILGRTNLGTL